MEEEDPMLTSDLAFDHLPLVFETRLETCNERDEEGVDEEEDDSESPVL